MKKIKNIFYAIVSAPCLLLIMHLLDSAGYSLILIGLGIFAVVCLALIIDALHHYYVDKGFKLGYKQALVWVSSYVAITGFSILGWIGVYFLIKHFFLG